MSTSHFSDLLLVFESLEVKYLVVGGYAVMLYTEPRFTKDLDVWVEPSDENAAKVYQALTRFGAPFRWELRRSGLTSSRESLGSASPKHGTRASGASFRQSSVVHRPPTSDTK
jgi:hypothetical protein